MSTYTFIACRASGTIEVHALDQEKGTLRRLSVIEGMSDVSTLVFDHERANLYAGRVGATPAISVFTVVAGGRLEHRGDVDLDYPPAFLAFDGDGLLIASYHGSALTRLPLDADGLPTLSEGRFDDTTSGKNIHAVAVTKDRRHVYATALGSDLILGYRRGGEGEPALVALEPTPVGPVGSGPRHLVISQDGTRLTVITEMTGEVITYHRDGATGTLSEAGRTSIVRDEDGLETGVARVGGAVVPDSPVWAAELRQADGGARWIATERTTSTVSVLDAGDAPRVIGRTGTEERPRAAAVSPSGDLVLIGGETSSHVSIYRLKENGVLEPTQRIETGGNPAWFAFQRVD